MPADRPRFTAPLPRAVAMLRRAITLVVAAVLLATVVPGTARAHDAGASMEVSSSPARTAPTSLSGATLSGPAYLFFPAEASIAKVEFWLDSPTMVGVPRQVDSTPPFDFAGGTAEQASPFLTTSVADGAHLISARVTHLDGHAVEGEVHFTVANAPTGGPSAGQVSRVNAGGAAVTTGGVGWSADANFSGGKAYTNAKVTAIAGTADDALYLSERSATSNLGGFGYAIPAPASGSYTVTLHFAEIYFGATGGGSGGAGKRVFSANLEGGSAELVDFDIFAAVGAMTATQRTYTIPVTDGTLNIDFTAKVNQPKVSAISVTAPGTTAPPAENPAPPTGDQSPFAWDTVAPAPIGRSEAQGAAVGDRIYAFSGFDVGTTTTARSDVYDTTTNTWSRIRDFPVEITHSPVVADGTTLWFVGGYVGDHPGPSTRSVWKYNTLTDTYTAGPPLPAPRGAGAAAIVGRELHFFGGTSRVAGSTADPDEPDHWVLNLDGGTTWSARADLPNPRNHLGGIAAGGTIYAIGGQYNENEKTGLQTDVHRYDPATNAWTKVASLPKARSHLAVVERDGQIIAMGGTDPGGAASRDVTSYDPASNAWSVLPALPGGRKTAVAGVVGDVLYFTGGSHAKATYAGRFAQRWETGPAMPVALGEVAGGVIGSTLYLVGESSTATLALDLGTGEWRQNLAVRQFPGHHHTAEVISGRLYLFGGLGAGAGKVQIYDPATNSWTLGPDMPFAAGSTASALIGGNVYVAGGVVGATTTDRTARFDPVALTWTNLAPMPQGRNHAAAGADGGKLYVAGGRGAGSGDGNSVANGFDTLQVYDPATNSWRSSDTAGSGLRPLPQARGGMGKAVFRDGEMYVFGGETLNGAGATAQKVYARVDIYDPRAGTWRSGTSMPTARHGVFPVVVGNRITLAGGGVAAGYSSSSVTETYTTR